MTTRCLLQMRKHPQQPLIRTEFPNLVPPLNEHSTPASQQVLPHVVLFRCLTLLIERPHDQRCERESFDPETIRF